MARPSSLRTRILAACFLIGTGLSLLFGVLMLVALEVVEQDQIDRLVSGELEAFATAHAVRPDIAPPRTTLLNGWVAPVGSTAGVPAPLRGLGPGIVDVELNGTRHRITVADRDGWRYWFSFDLRRLVAWERRMAVVVAALVLLSTVLAALLGQWLSNRVVQPLTRLARQVEEGGMGRAEGAFAEGYGSDEVGLLARAVDDHVRRLGAYAAREREFTHFVSHELRTPLAVIASGTELVLESEGLSPAARERLLRCQGTVASMSETVEALLTLARVESGAASERLEDAGRILEEVIEECRFLLAGKPVKLDLAITGAPRIMALPGALRLVMRNLVGNAFLYTEAGTVTVGLDPDGFEVRDTGPGLRAAPAAPPAGTNGQGGHGLGLAIVRRVCERYDWSVEVRSDADGTCARVDFEAAGASAPAPGTG